MLRPMPIGALVTVPELQGEGLARLASRNAGYVGIRFLASGAEMTQEERAVARYCLLPGTRVRAKIGGGGSGGEEAEREGEITVARVRRDQATGLLAYGWRPAEGGDELVL